MGNQISLETQLTSYETELWKKNKLSNYEWKIMRMDESLSHVIVNELYC